MSTETSSSSAKPTMSPTLREDVSTAYCDQMRTWEMYGDHLRSSGFPEAEKAASCANSNAISREVSAAHNGEPDWPEILALFSKYSSTVPTTVKHDSSCQDTYNAMTTSFALCTVISRFLQSFEDGPATLGDCRRILNEERNKRNPTPVLVYDWAQSVPTMYSDARFVGMTIHYFDEETQQIAEVYVVDRLVSQIEGVVFLLRKTDRTEFTVSESEMWAILDSRVDDLDSDDDDDVKAATLETARNT